ncbi:MAG: DHA2 family efflux MFS transporter permease subunit [Alphaproteobacteria bacterium]|nr:DHA2 family efflux MFS transporter permease subunit [Alphaproteobacteria bacterium]
MLNRKDGLRDDLPVNGAPGGARPDASMASAEVRPTGARLVLITIAMMLMMSMFWLDAGLVTMVLPRMQGGLSATLDQVSWVLTSFIVAIAVMTPVIGRLTERFGRNQVMMVCVIGFAVMSCLCAYAHSVGEMMVYRFVQGLLGAPLPPLSQAALLDIYPKERHGLATTLWSLGVPAGPSLGPLLGGYLSEEYSWQLVFFVTPPLAFYMVPAILLLMGRSATGTPRRLDLPGYVMIAVAVVALQLVFDRGERADWFNSELILVLAVVSLLGFYLFCVHSVTTDQPLIDLGMLRDRNFALGMVLILGFGVLQYATLALLPPFVQNVLSYPVDVAGEVLAPRGLGLIVAMTSCTFLLPRADARILMVIGLTSVAATLKVFSLFNLDSGNWAIILTGVWQGFSLAFVFVPLTAIAFSSLEARYRPVATAFYNLGQNIGGSIGIAVMVTWIARDSQSGRAAMVEHATLFNELFTEPHLPEAWTLQTAAGLARLETEIGRQASLMAYVNDFHALMLLALGAIPFILLASRPRRPAPHADESRAGPRGAAA